MGNVQTEDLSVIDNAGTRCGCCHNRIIKGAGVTFGRPCFQIPAINICRRCVEIALAVLGPDAKRIQEGNA